jgi:hypothetical protein
MRHRPELELQESSDQERRHIALHRQCLLTAGLRFWLGPKRASGLGEALLVFIRGYGARTNDVVW